MPSKTGFYWHLRMLLGASTEERQLSQLEEHELVQKKVYHQLPPEVECSVTETGKSLLLLVIALGY